MLAYALVLAAQATLGSEATQDAPVAETIVLPVVEPVTSDGLVLPRDTPVHLMVMSEVSTKDHQAGYKFRLRVDQPVMVAGTPMIPAGTIAWGEVVEADRSGNVGKSGSLSARLTHIDYAGQQIPIEGGTTADGKSGKSEAILGVLAMGPLGLFAKGNNAKIKAGERMTAFTTQDTVLADVR